MNLSDFTVKDIKITLRSGDGKVIVIEPPCEHEAAKKPAEPARASKPRATKPPEATATARKPPPQASKPPEAQPEPPRKGKPPASKQAKDLSWQSHQEHGYSGVAARTAEGVFKILETKQGKWALFYDQVGVNSVPLGCFKTREVAVEKGHEKHLKGMPDQRRVPNACDTEPDEPAAEPAKKPPTPSTKPPAPGKPSAQDAELLKSFAEGAEKMLDELDDDGDEP